MKDLLDHDIVGRCLHLTESELSSARLSAFLDTLLYFGLQIESEEVFQISYFQHILHLKTRSFKDSPKVCIGAVELVSESL